MRSNLVRCAAVASSLVVLAGCGQTGSTPDAAASRSTEAATNLRQIRATLATFDSAISAGDGTKACAALTADGQRLVAAQQITGRDVTGNPLTDCAHSVEKLAAASGDAGRLGDSGPAVTALKDSAVLDVQVRGDAAQAEVKTKSFAYTALMVKSGGAWKASVPPGFSKAPQ